MDRLAVAQLVQRCQAGDALAIETLVRTYQRVVYRLAISILDDPAEAEEATQDAFVAATRALRSYRGESAFSTWLYTITLNVCRGRLRRQRSRERLTRTLRALFFGQAGQGFNDPEDQTIRSESEREIWKAVSALDEKHRLPVILRYYHELSIAEIAGMLQVSERTIHTRLSTGHERLRAALSGKPNL